MQGQHTVSITTKPNVALSNKEAAEVSVVTKATEQQLSVAIAQVDLTTEAAAVRTECSPPKKATTI